MQIELTPEQEDVVKFAIARGRIARPEDAVAQAMAFWIERERELADLIASLDEADASDARGESISIENDEELERVFDEIKSSYHAKTEAKDGPAR